MRLLHSLIFFGFFCLVFAGHTFAHSSIRCKFILLAEERNQDSAREDFRLSFEVNITGAPLLIGGGIPKRLKKGEALLSYTNKGVINKKYRFYFSGTPLSVFNEIRNISEQIPDSSLLKKQFIDVAENQFKLALDNSYEKERLDRTYSFIKDGHDFISHPYTVGSGIDLLVFNAINKFLDDTNVKDHKLSEWHLRVVNVFINSHVPVSASTAHALEYKVRLFALRAIEHIRVAKGEIDFSMYAPEIVKAAQDVINNIHAVAQANGPSELTARQWEAYVSFVAQQIEYVLPTSRDYFLESGIEEDGEGWDALLSGDLDDNDYYNENDNSDMRYEAIKFISLAGGANLLIKSFMHESVQLAHPEVSVVYRALAGTLHKLIINFTARSSIVNKWRTEKYNQTNL